jgi:hypothetical protein
MKLDQQVKDILKNGSKKEKEIVVSAMLMRVKKDWHIICQKDREMAKDLADQFQLSDMFHGM